MQLSIITAVAENGVIGRDGKLPWIMADDLRWFKQLTMGHTIIMGRRTWESIGRPLPGRRMIVVTRQSDYHVGDENVHKVSSLDAALEAAQAAGDDEVFVIGGAELYREALPRATRLYYTQIHADVNGDTHFPHVNWNEWQLLQLRRYDADVKNEHPHDQLVYQRR
jgi:dihydrofolate reductase